MRSILKIISLFFIIVLLASCAAKKERSVKVKDIHKGPLIKPSDVVIEGRKEMDKMIKAGPKPYEEIDELPLGEDPAGQVDELIILAASS